MDKNSVKVNSVVEPLSKGKRGLGKKDSFLTKLVKVFEKSNSSLTKRQALVLLITNELESEDFNFDNEALLNLEVNLRMSKYRTRFYAAFCKGDRANSISGSDFYKDTHFTSTEVIDKKQNKYFIGSTKKIEVVDAEELN